MAGGNPSAHARDTGSDAERAGVTPSYLTRAFSTVTGHALMRYARARRLSEAARILALGVPDILGLALDIGYGSHEAFTRAFRDHFGVTPEAVRDSRTTANLELTEPLLMIRPSTPGSPIPIEDRKALLLAGLIKTFAMKDIGGIPALCVQFNDAAGRAIATTGATRNHFGASLAFSEEKDCKYNCLNH